MSQPTPEGNKPGKTGLSLNCGVLGTDLGHDRRPRSARSSRHRPWTRPSTSARSSDVCALNEWLSGGPGCRRRVRHGSLASLNQNGYGLGPYCMSVQCGRVGNPPANLRKPYKDLENQHKFRDPGLVRFVNRTRRLLTQTVVTEGSTYNEN